MSDQEAPCGTLIVPKACMPEFALAVSELSRLCAEVARDSWHRMLEATDDEERETAIRAQAESESKLTLLSALYARLSIETTRMVEEDRDSLELTSIPADTLTAILEELVRGIVPMAKQRVGSLPIEGERVDDLRSFTAVEEWALDRLSDLRANIGEWTTSGGEPAIGLLDGLEALESDD